MKVLQKENKELKKALKLAQEFINTSNTFNKSKSDAKEKLIKAFKKVGREITI